MECAYYFVDGTWTVPTTCLQLCGRHMECAYYFGCCRQDLLQPCFHFVFDLIVIDFFMGEE
jgi:hypothetical protein